MVKPLAFARCQMNSNMKTAGDGGKGIDNLNSWNLHSSHKTGTGI
jgi:hypothetical protein